MWGRQGYNGGEMVICACPVLGTLAVFHEVNRHESCPEEAEWACLNCGIRLCTECVGTDTHEPHECDPQTPFRYFLPDGTLVLEYEYVEFGKLTGVGGRR